MLQELRACRISAARDVEFSVVGAAGGFQCFGVSRLPLASKPKH